MPYDLDWIERGQTPNELTSYVLRLIVPDYADLSFDDWFEVKFEGRYLWEWGYWNLLYRVVSPDAYSFLRDGVGYDTNVANGNAVNLMFTAGDTSGEDHYKTLVYGYESLPRALAERYVDSHGGDLRKNHRLAAIRKVEGGYKLDFERTETRGYVTRGGGEFRSLEAENVVLAMPRRSIELIDWAAKEEDPFLRRNLESIIMQAAFKLFLGYSQPWWRALGLQAGRSLTDMPIRQSYYFGTEGEQPNSEEVGNLNSLLMSSYNDLATVPFWKGLERGAAFAGDPGNPWLGGGGPMPPGAIAPTDAVVREAHRQVTELHDQRELPLPYTAAFMDWSEDPYGGGWHSWKAGFKYNEIMPRMRHPVEGENVYICGAAYSSDQGWVEGALETAEQMLTEDMGIEKHRCSKGWRHDPLKHLKHKLSQTAKGPRESDG
ncbi:MAG: FAD-dependent oxidoreductase [Acidobacteriota bacterium]|nr:FAD-dependent oxidoreductase [Acidobacteriota bacterium]